VIECGVEAVIGLKGGTVHGHISVSYDTYNSPVKIASLQACYVIVRSPIIIAYGSNGGRACPSTGENHMLSSR
jgi:hypothetical protein